jgi:long-chain acyl-CoA synthetase
LNQILNQTKQFMKKTIIDHFEQAVAKFANCDFLLENTTGTFEPTTYSQVREFAYQFGAGLIVEGIKAKNTVTILSEGRNMWIIAELGIFYAGAISIPLSLKLEESNDLLFRLKHGDVSCIIVSGRQLAKIRLIKDQLPLLKKIIVLDPIDSYEKDEVAAADLMSRGKIYLESNRENFLKVGQSLQNDDIATITYTSGTTADPKGVVLTHRNYTANVEQALSCIDFPHGYKMLIILPLDHCFAHVVGVYAMMAKGSRIATVPSGKTAIESLKNIPLSIAAVKPNILLSVPALAKSFKKNIESSVEKSGKTKLFKFALNTAIKYNKEGWNKGQGTLILLKPLVFLFDKLIFSKVRMAMGGELKYFIGGGALLDIDLQRFYYALGIPMFQGYGLSEATPVISTNSPLKHRLGSSGILVRPMDLKICDENGNEVPTGVSGEIVIKGENVMSGYWKNPKSTSETVKDGWLYTGDMGYMHESGFLYVLGRFKSLLISSDGEKYAPEGIEETIAEKSHIIQNVMLYNDQSPYTICVVQVDKNAVPKGKDGIIAVKAEFDKYRSGGEFSGIFPERWLPTTFVIADEPFSEHNRMINSTMKLVRSVVEKTYADRISFAFTPEGKNPVNEFNLKALNL